MKEDKCLNFFKMQIDDEAEGSSGKVLSHLMERSWLCQILEKTLASSFSVENDSYSVVARMVDKADE